MNVFERVGFNWHMVSWAVISVGRRGIVVFCPCSYAYVRVITIELSGWSKCKVLYVKDRNFSMRENL